MYKAENRSGLRPVPGQAPPRRRWRGPRWRRVPWLTITVIAAGGILGALARQGLWAVFPRPAGGGFDWTTFGINVAGCALIGALMAVAADLAPAPRLTTAFLGTGVLGGFTTFSTYIVSIQRSITDGVPQTGLAYLAGTLAAALLATYTGMTLTRLAVRAHREDRP